jgi:hypothetical protein
MGGDYSRTSFDPLRDFIGVGMQQGHPTTDADWNELAAVFERRMRAGAVDTFGRAVVPRETPTGFEIRLAPGPKLMIGRGRMYVDGHLVENHGRIGKNSQGPVFDRARNEPDGAQTGVLDEPISTQQNDFIDFTAQPYLPVALALPKPPGAGPHVAYLKVWKREVTAVKDPRLLEPALGGIDTATRWQTVWQVRLLENVGAGATCGTKLSLWDELIAPSPARLTTGTMVVEDPEDPCLIPPGGGYRGLENQYYRVEIHTGGPPGAANAPATARFKWSRDNASVAARIESIEPVNKTRVRVRNIGRDSILRFAVGDWVEITDDIREFSGQSGDMHRIVSLSGTDEIELNAAVNPNLVPTAPDSTAARNTRMIRWDQKGKVRLADGSPYVDLDTSADGLIPIPPGGKAVQLEAGITVSFTTEPAGGALRALDHWCFAARTEGAQIEMLAAAPPLGIHYHYARLAVVTLPSAAQAARVRDCRIFWPPAEECGCTVCVSAEGHNSGRYTIQDAIADLPAAGGTVCLGPGDFMLGATPVVLKNRKSVRLRGHGFGSELAYAAAGGAIRVEDSSDIRITDLAVTVVSTGQFVNTRDLVDSSALDIASGIDVTVSRTRLRVTSGPDGNDFGVLLSGWVIDVTVNDNLIEAVMGIGTRVGIDPTTGAPRRATLYDLRITDNRIVSEKVGVALNNSFYFGPVQIEANTIFGGDAGISASGIGLGVPGRSDAAPAGMWICANSISFADGGSGIACGILDLRVLDNDISGRQEPGGIAAGACVRLIASGIPLSPADAQIVGNRLGNVDGHAISIEAPQASMLIKRNVMRDCERGAVRVGPNVSIRSLAFDNNLIERAATRESPDLRAAVALSGVADLRVVGNTIRGVGAANAGSVYCVGFDINGAAKLDLSHNLITDIGFAKQGASSIGVFIRGAVLSCAVTANQIFDSKGSGETAGNWCAIFIQNQQSFSQTIPPSAEIAIAAVGPAAAMPAFFTLGDTVFAVGTNQVWPFAALADTQIRIDENIIGAAHSASNLPLVKVVGGAGNCIFSENQCTLQARGTVSIPSVWIQDSRIVAANNIVRRQSVAGAGTGGSMALFCDSLGVNPPRPMVTVLGNITTSTITVNGPALPAPFAPLNILSN